MRNGILKLAALAALGLAATAQAALPPKYQRQREMAEVLKAAVEALDKPVDQVARIGEDRYRVLAGRCSVTARIETVQGGPAMVGPRNFTVRLDRARCR